MLLQKRQQQANHESTTTFESTSMTSRTNRSTATITSSRSRVDGNSASNKAVKFSEVHIRDYERDIGDNPSCSSGPPIG